MTSPQTRKIVNTAPVGSIDLLAFDDNGTPYEIWPCNDCYPWHFEVVRAGSDIMVREWHAVDCTLFQQLLANE